MLDPTLTEDPVPTPPVEERNYAGMAVFYIAIAFAALMLFIIFRNTTFSDDEMERIEHERNGTERTMTP